MKKIFIFATSLIMVVVLCFSVIGCSVQTATSTVTDFEATSFDEVVVESTEEETVTENSGRHETIKREMKLMASKEVTRGANYVSRTLIATVLPEGTVNKEVSWSIAWETPSDYNSSYDVTSYFDVIPSYEGSNVAEVRCYAEPQFADSIAIITATAVSGECTATCRVQYQGIATDIYISSGFEVDEDGNFLVDAIPHKKVEYVFECYPTNYVGYIYDSEVRVSIHEWTGDLTVSRAEYDASTKEWHYYGELIQWPAYQFTEFVSAKFINNNLVVTVDYTKIYDTYYREGNFDIYTGYFHSVTANANCILTIRLYNAASNIEEFLNLKLVSGAGSISLNTDIIIF